MSKPKLLIISDLFGFRKEEWVQNYIKLLENTFAITLYDVRTLAELENMEASEKEIHHHFVNGGIEKAVDHLITQVHDSVYVLAFSVGGTIAWKAGLSGLKIEKLIAISSTRLRAEINKPVCEIQLVFGEKDMFKPSEGWFQEMQIEPTIVYNIGHDLYKKAYVKQIIEMIKQ